METIVKEHLKEMLEKGEDFALVDVLNADSFNKAHIKGSINIPVHTETEAEFLDNVAAQIPDKNKKIIVYCASFECQASPEAARKLEAAGYTNVLDYEGGLKDWSDAGYDLERSE